MSTVGGNTLALSPGSPIVSMHARKEWEPGIQCQVCDVGPYTTIRRVANHNVGEHNF